MLTVPESLRNGCDTPLIPQKATGKDIARGYILMAEAYACEKGKRESLIRVIDAHNGAVIGAAPKPDVQGIQ